MFAWGVPTALVGGHKRYYFTIPCYVISTIFFYKHFLCVWSTNETAGQVNEKQQEGIEIRPKFFSGQGTRSYNERNEMTMGSRVE